MNLLKSVAAAAMLCVVATSVNAADSWAFTVYNKSSVAVKSFKTKEDGEWSKNWIRGDKMRPGEVFDMDFGTSEGDCVVRTRITFVDDSYFDENIDYCKADRVYLFERHIEWD